MSNSNSTPSVQRVVLAIKPVYEQIVDDLTRSYVRAWGPRPELEPNPTLGSADRLALPSHASCPRRWGVVEEAWPRVRRYAEGIPRSDDPGVHPGLRWLSQQSELIAVVEGLIVTLGERMLPWFGAMPSSIDWIAVAAEKNVSWLGYWHSVIGYTLEEEFELKMDQWKHDPRIPKFWSTTVVHSLLWRIAADAGLTVTGQYRPPRALVGRRYSELGEPYTPLLNIWRCGVMFEASLMAGVVTPAVVYVNGRALAASSGSG